MIVLTAMHALLNCLLAVPRVHHTFNNMSHFYSDYKASLPDRVQGNGDIGITIA